MHAPKILRPLFMSMNSSVDDISQQDASAQIGGVTTCFYSCIHYITLGDASEIDMKIRE